jgi:hypothetical protein
MAAGSFTLTRRNNKRDYIIIHTMQFATVRHENIDCPWLTKDAALLLFGMNISTTLVVPRPIRCRMLLFDMKISTTLAAYILCSDMKTSTACNLLTMQHCYYWAWKSRLRYQPTYYAACYSSTRTCRQHVAHVQSGILVFSIKISTTLLSH